MLRQPGLEVAQNLGEGGIEMIFIAVDHFFSRPCFAFRNCTRALGIKLIKVFNFPGLR